MTQAPLPERTDDASGPPALAIGAVLVAVGLLLFIGQYFDVGIGDLGWPFIILGFLFFEGLIGISGERLPLAEWVLPAAVIAIGVVVLVRGLMQRGNVQQP